MDAKKSQKIVFSMLVLGAVLLACATSVPESGGSSEDHPKAVGIYARETSSLPPAGGFQPPPTQLGPVYLESKGNVLVVYREEGSNELGRLEFVNRPLISDQVRWGPGDDQVVDVKDGLAEICIDMGEKVGGPCYKIQFLDGEWLVQSQLHISDLSEAEPPDEPSDGDFILLPERSIIELHTYREEQNLFPGEYRSDFPITFYGGYFTVEVNGEGNLVIQRVDQDRLAAKIVLFPSGTIQICPPCQSQGINPEKDIFTVSLEGETPQGIIGGPIVVVRYREGSWQVQVP